jgi:hypothetical protein
MLLRETIIVYFVNHTNRIHIVTDMNAATQRPGNDFGVFYATVFRIHGTEKYKSTATQCLQAERILPWKRILLTVKRFLSNQIIGIHDNANTGSRNLATGCILFGMERPGLRRDIKQSQLIPCGGGVEYLHRSPASRRRRRKGKSQIWDSKMWLRVPRDSDPRTTALARTSSSCKRQIRPRQRLTSTNPQLSDSNKNLVVSPRWVLYSKTDWPTDRRS